MRKLTSSEIRSKIKSLKGWKYSAKQKAIYADLEFKNFMAVVRFIQKIAQVAEAMDHHPDLHLTRYRRLRIVLNTHVIGAVSERDFALARKINHKLIAIENV